MIIGVPKEIKAQENRVALLPSGARHLSKKHQVLVETGAGSGIGVSDDDYRQAGAEIVATHEEVFARGELILKVKEPLACECPLLREGQILFTYLHLAANRPLTDALLASKVTGIAYESVVANRRLPLLEPMSEIAGRMSVIMGAYFLEKHCGGRGLLLGGVPGVLPGHVTIIGGGTAGVNAARMAIGLGADVTILDVDLERLRYLDHTLKVHTLYSSETHLREVLPRTDLLIGAVLIPGAAAPKLVTRDMLGLMKKGSVLVDIAIDQGGCIETSRPTTHAEPVYEEEGVVHYCVANMPGAYALTATQALTNATFPYVERLANDGLQEAFRRRPDLATGLNVWKGQLTQEAVASTHGLSFKPYSDLNPLLA